MQSIQATHSFFLKCSQFVGGGVLFDCQSVVCIAFCDERVQEISEHSSKRGFRKYLSTVAREGSGNI